MPIIPIFNMPPGTKRGASRKELIEICEELKKRYNHYGVFFAPLGGTSRKFARNGRWHVIEPGIMFFYDIFVGNHAHQLRLGSCVRMTNLIGSYRNEKKEYVYWYINKCIRSFLHSVHRPAADILRRIEKNRRKKCN